MAVAPRPFSDDVLLRCREVTEVKMQQMRDGSPGVKFAGVVVDARPEIRQPEVGVLTVECKVELTGFLEVELVPVGLPVHHAGEQAEREGAFAEADPVSVAGVEKGAAASADAVIEDVKAQAHPAIDGRMQRKSLRDRATVVAAALLSSPAKPLVPVQSHHRKVLLAACVAGVVDEAVEHVFGEMRLLLGAQKTGKTQAEYEW